MLCQMKRSRQSRRRLYIYQSHMSRLRHLLPVRYFGKRPHIYKLVHQNPAEIRRLLHSAKHIVHTFLAAFLKFRSKTVAVRHAGSCHRIRMSFFCKFFEYGSHAFKPVRHAAVMQINRIVRSVRNFAFIKP